MTRATGLLLYPLKATCGLRLKSPAHHQRRRQTGSATHTPGTRREISRQGSSRPLMEEGEKRQVGGEREHIPGPSASWTETRLHWKKLPSSFLPTSAPTSHPQELLALASSDTPLLTVPRRRSTLNVACGLWAVGRDEAGAACLPCPFSGLSGSQHAFPCESG